MPDIVRMCVSNRVGVLWEPDPEQLAPEFVALLRAFLERQGTGRVTFHASRGRVEQVEVQEYYRRQRSE